MGGVKKSRGVGDVIAEAVTRYAAEFWGKAGAGMMIVCPDDNTALLLLRASWVDQPGTWGVPGGAVSGTEGWREYGDEGTGEAKDYSDVSWATAVKETEEELGVNFDSVPHEKAGQTVFKKGDFTYTTYIVAVTKEVKDMIARKASFADAESVDMKWFKLDDLMNYKQIEDLRKKLHFGVQYVMENYPKKQPPQTAVASRKRLAATDAPIQAKPPGPVEDLFAKDKALGSSEFERVGGPTGTNPGGFYQRVGESGETEDWYLKQYDNPMRARNEVLAAKLYSLANINVPEVHPVMFGNKVGVASKIIPGLRQDPDALTGGRLPNGVAEGVAIDAWLSNYDVVGLVYDNLLVRDDPEGPTAYRIDHGGALTHRARGSPKSWWGDKVHESESFFDPSKSSLDSPLQNAVQVFRNLTPEQVKDSISRLAAIRDEDIRAVVQRYGHGSPDDKNALAQTLVNRKNYIIQNGMKLSKAT
jgi:8-oxo-dGTP pyrophosphatase MutT (NUDIX family)